MEFSEQEQFCQQLIPNSFPLLKLSIFLFTADSIRIPHADLQMSQQRARRKFSVRENARAART